MKIIHLLLVSVMLFFQGCREELARDLSDRDARKIIGVLSNAGIVPERSQQADNLWTIHVAQNSLVKAMQLVDHYRLISQKPEAQEEGSLFVSELEQQLRYQKSVAQQVEDTLRSLDGVLDARVIVTMPKKDLLSAKQEQNPGSGSVLLIGAVDLVITQDEIKDLVAGASGLPSSQIAVVIKPASMPSVITEHRPESATPAQSAAMIIAGLLVSTGGICLIMMKKLKRPGEHYVHGSIMQ